MNAKQRTIALTVAAVLVSGCAMGRHDMSPRRGMMGTMDANGDGMLSKDEFMKGHEVMFDRMKGPNGMISIKDMPMH